jgi:hypothetical protein
MFVNLLKFLLVSPLIGIFILVFIPANKTNLIKNIALNFSILPFFGFLLVWAFFKKSIAQFQFVNKLIWIPYVNLNIVIGIDGISLFFLLLTTLLIPICILISWSSIKKNLKYYLVSFLLLEFFLIGVFCILDLLFFYIFFESVLIPMFLIVEVWGSRERKILASYYFFLYTLLGSIIMLLSILYVYCQVGTTDYEMLLTFSFSELEQKFLWFTFFLAFASKIIVVFVNLWLPEAHVETPTAGSAILASVLLKLGTYGFIRFSLLMFPQKLLFFVSLIYLIFTVGIISIFFKSIWFMAVVFSTIVKQHVLNMLQKLNDSFTNRFWLRTKIVLVRFIKKNEFTKTCLWILFVFVTCLIQNPVIFNFLYRPLFLYSVMFECSMLTSFFFLHILWCFFILILNKYKTPRSKNILEYFLNYFSRSACLHFIGNDFGSRFEEVYGPKITTVITTQLALYCGLNGIDYFNNHLNYVHSYANIAKVSAETHEIYKNLTTEQLNVVGQHAYVTTVTNSLYGEWLMDHNFIQNMNKLPPHMKEFYLLNADDFNQNLPNYHQTTDPVDEILFRDRLKDSLISNIHNKGLGEKEITEKVIDILTNQLSEEDRASIDIRQHEALLNSDSYSCKSARELVDFIVDHKNNTKR